MTRRELILAAIAAGAVLVLTFMLEHYRDANRDRELEQLHGMIARDSSTRIAAVERTDTASAKVSSGLAASVRTDTIWLNAKAAADVAAIVNASVPDSVKIRELAHVDTVLIAAGDVMRDTTAQLRAHVAGLQAQFGAERLSWQRERADLARALEVSESRHRHWGLGVTIGPTVVRDPAGVVRAGPIGASVGITYRL